MKIEDYTLDELKDGYIHPPHGGAYTCILCGRQFEEGEIHPLDGRFFEAERAIRHHLETAHPNRLQLLVEHSSKYNTLTENQRRLALLFAAGLSDKAVAAELGVAVSTVRHQKFIFREKAKQARHYLALYEQIFQNTPTGGSPMVPIHDDAKMVDQRYVITEDERAHILNTAFSSLQPLRLKSFSPKEKKKIVILTQIAQVFEQGREYTEKEVNGLLSPIYEDYATLRRYLVMYGFMQRTRDGARYWLN